MRFSLFKKREKPIEKQHAEKSAYFLINWCGFTIQWDCFDVIQSRMGLYAITFYWRGIEPRAWWRLYINDFSNDYPNASLEYSRGRRGKQVAGWKLSGPLVKFVGTHL